MYILFDPPLLEEDLPSGEWLCHRCRTTSEVEEPILIPQPCGAEDLESEIYPRHPTEFSAIEIDQETVNPLNVLITAATVRNPTQYQLPYELSCTLQLPDCLEPPLTSLPTGRWMCFNHSEFMADQKLLTSVSFSERVKLWDKFSGPVSQDAMKLHFLTKVDKHHPPFRRKIRLPNRNAIVVSMVSFKCEFSSIYLLVITVNHT
ncbi:UNVERIFIED_CONTAM: Phf12 [Trichonephila clavipes]